MKVYGFIAMALMSFNIWADATISGVVRDGSNNPITGVQVFVVNSFTYLNGNAQGGVYIDYSAITDANGRYTITIPYGGMSHAIAYDYGLSEKYFEFENQSIVLEFASAIAIPHRWNDSGGRALNCALGCAAEGVSDDEKILLGSGNFLSNLDDVIIEGAGKVYSGKVLDKESQAIENPTVQIQSATSSGFSVGYLPAVIGSSGNYSFPMVPNDAEMYVFAHKSGYVKTFHDGTQCNLYTYCLPAEVATNSQNDLTLIQAGSLVINPPELPVGVTYIDRYVRLFDYKGDSAFIGSGVCEWHATSGDFPLNACRIENLLPSQQYHVVFFGYNRDENNVRTSLIRKYQNNQQTGCGMQYDDEYIPATGLTVVKGQDTTIDHPVLNPGHEISGYAIDKNTQLPITGNPNFYDSLDLEVLDSSTLQTAGILNLTFNSSNELTFESCGSAAVSDGSYYLSAANQATYTSFMRRGEDVGDYKRFVYDGIDCQGKVCDFTGATPIVVNGNDVTGIELELEKGSRIEGCFFDNNQLPLLYQNGTDNVWSKISANIYSDENELIETAQDFLVDIGSDQLQICYSSSAMPAGNYYVRTNNGSGKLIDRRNIGSMSGTDFSYGYFDTTPGMAGANCSGDLCVMNTPIALDGSTHVSRDFYLTEGSVISGALKDNVTGSLIRDPNIRVEIYQNDMLIGQYQFISDNARFLTPGLADGNYEIRLSGNASYINTSLLNRGSQPSTQLTQSIPVTIDGASVDIGVITAITDMIFKDGLDR